jgi:hypothetical protein
MTIFHLERAFYFDYERIVELGQKASRLVNIFRQTETETALYVDGE